LHWIHILLEPAVPLWFVLADVTYQHPFNTWCDLAPALGSFTYPKINQSMTTILLASISYGMLLVQKDIKYWRHAILYRFLEWLDCAGGNSDRDPSAKVGAQMKMQKLNRAVNLIWIIPGHYIFCRPKYHNSRQEKPSFSDGKLGFIIFAVARRFRKAVKMIWIWLFSVWYILGGAGVQQYFRVPASDVHDHPLYTIHKVYRKWFISMVIGTFKTSKQIGRVLPLTKHN